HVTRFSRLQQLLGEIERRRDVALGIVQRELAHLPNPGSRVCGLCFGGIDGVLGSGHEDFERFLCLFDAPVRQSAHVGRNVELPAAFSWHEIPPLSGTRTLTLSTFAVGWRPAGAWTQVPVSRIKSLLAAIVATQR